MKGEQVRAEGISVSALDQHGYPRHRWYFYKEAFSPELVRHAIEAEELDKNAVVFDPFAGSGTVILEAALGGRAGYGFEVNPFALAVAKAKCARVSPSQLRSVAAVALGGAVRGKRSRLERFSTFCETANSEKWLFNRAVLRAFEGGWSAIDATRSSAAACVRIALIASAMDSSNARKDGKCLRYKREWERLNFDAGTFLEAFGRRISAMAEDLGGSKIHGSADLTLADSRRTLTRERFDLSVTSPPYLNSFDYSDVYRPELFLGGYVQDMNDLSAIRQRTVRSHVQVKWKDPKDVDFGEHYLKTFALVRDRAARLWNPRLMLMIQAYFEDLKLVLGRLRSKIKPRGSVWIVISTSAYAGVEIPVDNILAEVAERNSWRVRDIRILRSLERIATQQWSELRTSGGHPPQLRESIVILEPLSP